MISRRQANCLIATGTVLSACPDSLLAADFWDKKDPSDWSAEEIEKVLTKSPWAKQVALNADRNGGAPGGMGGGMPGGGGGGMPGGGGGGMPGGGGAGGGMPSGMGGGGMPGGAPGGGGPGSGPKPRIRWESALPILLASKKQVSAAERESYIVSVADLPFAGGGGPGRAGGPRGPSAEKGKAQPLELLVAYLHPKDKPSFRAENSETAAGVIRFYFPRANHLFKKDDKEITFEAQLGPTALKAKFSLKEMLYRGKLEL